SGKFLTTDGTTASWSDKPLVNNSNKTFALATGGYASAGDYSIAFGFYSISNSLSVAVGYSAEATQQGSVAVGRLAKAKANYAIQFGWGTNSDANTLKVANQNGNFEMMSADGTIPAERMSTTAGTTGQVLTKTDAGMGWSDVSSTRIIFREWE
ncbi:MAG: hypothetical protein UIH99_04800, partial [Alphaproteobacteria bacterium]|nr:hypothetical protein [Alphaproteobacteria bacterium]